MAASRQEYHKMRGSLKFLEKELLGKFEMS